jgi:hypothetical protein
MPDQQVSKRRVLLTRLSNAAHEGLRGILHSLGLAKPSLHLGHCLIQPHVHLRESQIHRDEQSAKTTREVQRPELPFRHAVFVRRAWGIL